MPLNLSGAGISLGTSLQEHARSKVDYLERKYHVDFAHLHGVFSRESPVLIHISIDATLSGHSAVHFKASAKGGDPYYAFDLALSHLEKSLRRHSTRIKGRALMREAHRKDHIVPDVEFQNFVFASQFNEIDEEADLGDAAPPLVSSEKISIARLSVGDALMKMELEDLPVLPFIDDATSKVSFLYQGKDGNVSMIACDN